MIFLPAVDFKAKVISERFIADQIKSIIFEAETDIKYFAGQFFMVKFNDLQRAYSVASAPYGRRFELCVEIIPGGKGSTYLGGLQVGEVADFKGPFGNCIIKPENLSDLIMVATGTGIAPIKAILEEMASRNDKRKIDLYFGVRFKEDLFYVSELETLASELSGLEINITLSRPHESWEGHKGRVTEHLRVLDFHGVEAQPGAQPDFYLCGNGDMIKEVRDLALAKGIAKTKIHVEIF